MIEFINSSQSKRCRIQLKDEKNEETEREGCEMKKREMDVEKIFQIAKMKRIAEKVKVENTIRLAKYGMPRF